MIDNSLKTKQQSFRVLSFRVLSFRILVQKSLDSPAVKLEK